MPDDPILLDERRHLDQARECLQAMARSASAIADYGVDELASQSLGRLRSERLAALGADPDAPPFFGRTDRTDETFHIGRRHVRDAAGDPVVIDWRAPIARPFYRATSTEPMGVRRRRRFGFADGQLTSFEDERLDAGEQLGLASQLLREEIERPRVGPMRDIVATIQPDQDDLVRAGIDVSLCIQGSPGTGKTAVGLHRAAYLLYTYPERLRRSGVLVVGPNRAFLEYIAQVLPSLGEIGIEQATVDELVLEPGGRQGTAPAPEAAATAVLKGDARMADVLRRALVAGIGRPTEDIVALVDTRRFRVPAGRVRRYVDDARRDLGPSLHYAMARERLRTQIAEDVRRQREDAGGAPSDAETNRVARSAQVREGIDALWPAVRPQDVLLRLYRDPAFLARCSATTLDDSERRQLADPATGRRRWSAADTVLLDELRGLIDGTPAYVHVVLDEAQDLSPMQCRAVARRCPLGSLTVLGDLAQATTAWAPGLWSTTLEHLGHPDARRQALTVGYRVPGPVLELANRLLPFIAPEVAPATAIRGGPDALRFAARHRLLSEIGAALAEPGTVGVLVPDAQVASVRAQLEDAGAVRPLRLVVVGAASAKGLEFDTVVLLEPAGVVAEVVAAGGTRAAGLRRLYVVLTRAVSKLTVVHDEPLPDELSAAGARE